MSSAGFFTNGRTETYRDITLVRDEPRAGVTPLDSIRHNGKLSIFDPSEEPGKQEAWITASTHDYFDLRTVR